MACSKNPLAGTSPNPSGEERIQIVPPVMMIRTRDSGYCEALADAMAGVVMTRNIFLVWSAWLPRVGILELVNLDKMLLGSG
jgi:hypothetical protein